MTGYAAVDSAVEAIKLGAREYLTKPFDFDRLRQVLVDIRLELERRAQVVALESQVARQLEFCGMLGRSPAMQEVFSLIQRLAPHAKVVLLSGETGTGKELAARAFHQAGPAASASRSSRSTARRSWTRCSRASCSATCAARSPARSNRSPASSRRRTAARCSSTRSASCRSSVQAKLLRALEYGEVQRVGSLQPKRVDVRSSRRPTAICAPRSRPDGSAAICSTGSTSSK